MQAHIILQKGDAVAHVLGKGHVDMAAFLDAALQVRFVEIGKGETFVGDGALELVAVSGHGGGGVDCVVDARAATGGAPGGGWVEGGGAGD